VNECKPLPLAPSPSGMVGSSPPRDDDDSGAGRENAGGGGGGGIMKDGVGGVAALVLEVGTVGGTAVGIPIVADEGGCGTPAAGAYTRPLFSST